MLRVGLQSSVVLCFVAGVGILYLLQYAVVSSKKFEKRLVPTYNGEPIRKNKIKHSKTITDLVGSPPVVGHPPQNNQKDNSPEQPKAKRPRKNYKYEVTKPPRYLRRQIRKDYKQRLPKVIGIGVKKCGTTALVRFLSLHPDILLPKHPESHFFDIDQRFYLGIDFYRQNMPYSAEHEITLEKSPRYFVLERVPERVKWMDPNMKILLVVCDPVKRAYSDYNFQAGRKKELLKIKANRPPPSTFDEFVETALEEIGRKKEFLKIRGETYEEFILRSWSSLVNRHYLSLLHTGIYSVYLQNWLRYFPPDQIHIIDGDELLTDPVKVINETEDFIGIERKVGEKNLFFDEQKGFYCMRYMNDDIRCLDTSKGTTRNKKLDELMKPETLEKLRAYYKPFNKVLFDMTGKEFAWAR